MNRVGTPDGLRTGLREPEAADLALLDELAHRARDVLDRHLRVDAMLVEDVEPLDPEPSEGGRRDGADLFGPVQSEEGAVLDAEAELGGDEDSVT